MDVAARPLEEAAETSAPEVQESTSADGSTRRRTKRKCPRRELKLRGDEKWR